MLAKIKQIETEQTGIQIIPTNKEKAATTITDLRFFSIPFVAISGNGIFSPPMLNLVLYSVV